MTSLWKRRQGVPVGGTIATECVITLAECSYSYSSKDEVDTSAPVCIVLITCVTSASAQRYLSTYSP